MRNDFPISEEQLQKLAEWLNSEEGRKALAESQERAQREIEELFKDIDPKILTEPFNI
jgi:uncharacterized UBP type Zn finger protein